ncbi:TonB-dependent receptor [Komagataeibacter xylinus E25]|nr:TonB-dependent receptor [Komagataeibacter xylinus E25]
MCTLLVPCAHLSRDIKMRPLISGRLLSFTSLATVSLIALFSGTPALAASAQQGNVAAFTPSGTHQLSRKSARSTQNEVLKVIGSRRSASRNAAATVTSLSSDEIRSLNINNPKQVAAFVPGLTAVSATSGSNTIFSIRGVGLDDYSGTNMSGVGVYLDGVLSPYPVFYNGQILDVQTIDVDKGPQGFTSGRSTTGGAINVTSVKPSDKFGGYVNFGYSSYNTKKSSFAINIPISSKVQNRLAFSYTNGDGWQHDVATSNRYGAQDLLALRNLTRFVIDNQSDLLLNIHYTRDRSTPTVPQNPQADSFYGVSPSTYGTAPDAPANAVHVGSSFLPMRKEDGGGISLTYTRNFRLGQFVSTTGLDVYRRHFADNYDGESLHMGDYIWTDAYLAQSHDMHVVISPVKRLHLTAGVYQSYDKIDSDYNFEGQDLLANPNGVLSAHFRESNISVGTYINTVTTLTKGLEFIAAGRYSYDDRSYKGGTYDEGGVYGPAGQYVAALNETRDTNRFTGRVGLKYTFVPGNFVYGTISNGYKVGTYFTAPTASPEALAYVRPENLVAYEVGIKSSLLHGKVDLQGSLFDYEYHNRQTLMNVYTRNGLASSLGSIPRARTMGGELQGSWHSPVPGLDLRASFAYLDGQVKQTVSDLRGLTLLAPITRNSALPYSPRFSWSAMAHYQHDITEHYRVALQVSYSWKDNYLEALGDPNGKVGKISSLGLRMTVSPKNNRWEASVYVDNLQNKHSDAYSFTTFDGTRAQYIQTPRWVGMDLRYNL